MTLEKTGWTAAVDQALRRSIPIMARPRPGQWQLQPDGLDRGSTWARIDEGWLHLSAPLSADAPSAWELLSFNGTLPGAARFVLNPSDGRLMLRADVCLVPGVCLVTRVKDAFDGFVAGASALRARPGGLPGDPGRSRGTDEPVHGDGLADDARRPASQRTRQLFADAGWPVRERSDDHLAVDLVDLDDLDDLDLDHGSAHAIVHGRSDGGLRVQRPVTDGVGAASVRDAMAVYLLASTALVKGARASSGGTADRASAWLEVGFDSTPCEAEVSEALSALSVAWRACRREVAVLQDPAVARAYLEMWAQRVHEDAAIGAAV